MCVLNLGSKNTTKGDKILSLTGNSLTKDVYSSKIDFKSAYSDSALKMQIAIKTNSDRVALFPNKQGKLLFLTILLN